MKVAVALLLDVPDGSVVSDSVIRWNEVVGGEFKHALFGVYGIRVDAVDVHEDPDVLFPPEGEV